MPLCSKSRLASVAFQHRGQNQGRVTDSCSFGAGRFDGIDVAADDQLKSMPKNRVRRFGRFRYVAGRPGPQVFNHNLRQFVGNPVVVQDGQAILERAGIRNAGTRGDHIQIVAYDIREDQGYERRGVHGPG